MGGEAQQHWRVPRLIVVALGLYMLSFIKQNCRVCLRGAAILLLCGILFLAFFIRIQSVPFIPDGQFTGIDPYFYYRNGQLISETGRLPARDMHRWLPLGRDLEQTLPLYSYALAYAHKVVSLCFPTVSLYQLTLYAPTVCFVMGLGILLLFLWSTFGLTFASLVGILLTILPGALDRSLAGFSDRDSWCLLLGILAVTTYLASLRTECRIVRFLWTFASGITLFFGGMSWEGFGVFLSVILVVELWRMLTSKTESGFGLYLLWVCTFVLPLYLISPAYHNGQSFSTHLRDFVLLPPLTLLGIRALRHLLLTQTPLADTLKPHARTLAFGLTLITLAVALLYTLTLLNAFDRTTVPFSQSRLMQTVNELNNPDFNYWHARYGSVFLLGSLGILFVSCRLVKKGWMLLAVPLGLFILTTFFRTFLDTWGSHFTTILFFLALTGMSLGILLSAWKRREVSLKNEHTYIAFTVWFLFWLGLSRDAIRYDFFLGVSIAFFTAELINRLSKTLSQKIRHSKYVTDVFRNDIPPMLLTACIIAGLLSIILFWPPAGAHATRALGIAKHLRSAKPGRTETLVTLQWIKAHLPRTAVVAATWESGSLLNVLGKVRTITDADHFLPHWISLYYRHVHCATNAREALEFLKTHHATHLMLTEKDIHYGGTYAFVGGYTREESKQFKPRHLQITPKNDEKQQHLTGLKQTPFAALTYDETVPGFLTARLKTGKLVNIPTVTFVGTQRQGTVPEDVPYGGALLYFQEDLSLEKVYYLSQSCWNSFAGRLYIHGQMQDVFTRVYPTDTSDLAKVKVWEIHYPPNIKPNPKYLATEPEE